MRNLDGRMTGRMTGRMDGKEDQHQHRTDGHHGYYYVGDSTFSGPALGCLKNILFLKNPIQ
jgi:hypothetical protein